MSKKVRASRKSTTLKSELLKALKCDESTLNAIAHLEKQLVTLKANKEHAKQKVVRAKMRNRKFYRHEHSKETLDSLKSYAQSLK